MNDITKRDVTNKFYLACFRDNVGENVGFHAIDGKGYVTDVDKAHLYTLEEAQRAWENGREYDQPISAEAVHQHLVRKADCQYLPVAGDKVEKSDRYLMFVNNKWNGNDVYWLRDNNDTIGTLDVTQAHVFTHDELSHHSFSFKAVPVPYNVVMGVARNTFSYRLFNARKMVQAMGLRVPERTKKHRRRESRPSSGKSRMNCPGCGKIHWQYNPHDFEGCRDVECEFY